MPGQSAPTIDVGRPSPPNKNAGTRLYPPAKFVGQSVVRLLYRPHTAIPSNQWHHQATLSPTGCHCHSNLPGPMPGQSAPTIDVGRPSPPNKNAGTRLYPPAKFVGQSVVRLLYRPHTAIPSNQWRHCCGCAPRFSNGRVRQKNSSSQMAKNGNRARFPRGFMRHLAQVDYYKHISVT